MPPVRARQWIPVPVSGAEPNNGTSVAQHTAHLMSSSVQVDVQIMPPHNAYMHCFLDDSMLDKLGPLNRVFTCLKTARSAVHGRRHGVHHHLFAGAEGNCPPFPSASAPLRASSEFTRISVTSNGAAVGPPPPARRPHTHAFDAPPSRALTARRCGCRGATTRARCQ